MASEQWSPEKQEALRQSYESKFNIKEYLDSGYMTPVGDHREDYIKFLTSALHRIFSIEIEGGQSILDLGCGPTIHAVISASSSFENIVSSEFLEVNRQEVRKWTRGDPSAYDWSYVFQLVANLEKESDPEKLKSRVQSRIKEVIACDVLAPNPIAPVQRTFDAVVSCACFESAANSYDSYMRIVANAATLIKPGGHLIMAGFFNCTHYFAGSTKFSAFPVTRQQVSQALSEAGLDVLMWMVQPRIEDGFQEDFTDSYVLLAHKNN